jgi:hypothetical protein
MTRSFTYSSIHCRVPISVAIVSATMLVNCSSSPTTDHGSGYGGSYTSNGGMGGVLAAGGTSSHGGTLATGGANNTTNQGGTPSVGGAVATGGSIAMAGATSPAGGNATGGTSTTGGNTATAGRSASAGAIAAAGSTAAAGTAATTAGSAGTVPTAGSAGTVPTAGAAGTGHPTFTAVYSSIIGVRCLPCHATGGGLTLGMLDMSTQPTAYTNLVGSSGTGIAAMGTLAGTSGTTCASSGLARVHPGNAATSLIWQKVYAKVQTTAAPCGNPMPPGAGSALPQSELDELAAWINGGALNN